MNFKERLQRAFPVWRQLLKRTTPFIRQARADGTSAGSITVANIKLGDQLIGVMGITTATSVVVDRTSTFSIAADGGIVGTADTTGDDLIITWFSWV